MPQILYISYDGMTDPLGQSQVLPYIIGLSKKGYDFTLLSCEKPSKYEKYASQIREITTMYGIDWHPLPFTSSPPILSKIKDLYILKYTAKRLHKKKKFDLIHCRSYVSADAGNQLKMKYNVKFLFDMRGFWVDERVDGGLWNQKNPFYKWLYKHYKKKEASYLKNADMIISLTEAGKSEMRNWKNGSNLPIKVIPCSTDFDLFNLQSDTTKLKSRAKLGLKESDLVVSYLGSLGTWYMLDEMLDFFELLKQKYPTAIFLFLTPDNPEIIYKKLSGRTLSKKDVIIKFANRNEVSDLLAASDFSLFFIKPSYSKISSSPTKLGEILAKGIPVICNSKVGDVQEIVTSTKGGLILDNLDNQSYLRVINEIPRMLLMDSMNIRNKAFEYYSLNKAVDKYEECYKTILT